MIRMERLVKSAFLRLGIPSVYVVRPPDGSLPPENGDVKRNFGGGYLIEGQPLSSPAQRHGQRVCLVFN